MADFESDDVGRMQSLQSDGSLMGPSCAQRIQTTEIRPGPRDNSNFREQTLMLTLHSIVKGGIKRDTARLATEFGYSTRQINRMIKEIEGTELSVRSSAIHTKLMLTLHSIVKGEIKRDTARLANEFGYSTRQINRMIKKIEGTELSVRSSALHCAQPPAVYQMTAATAVAPAVNPQVSHPSAGEFSGVPLRNHEISPSAMSLPPAPAAGSQLLGQARQPPQSLQVLQVRALSMQHGLNVFDQGTPVRGTARPWPARLRLPMPIFWQLLMLFARACGRKTLGTPRYLPLLRGAWVARRVLRHIRHLRTWRTLLHWNVRSR